MGENDRGATRRELLLYGALATGIAAILGKGCHDNLDSSLLKVAIDDVVKISKEDLQSSSVSGDISSLLAQREADIRAIGDVFTKAYFAEDAQVKESLKLGDHEFSSAGYDQKHYYRCDYARKCIADSFRDKTLQLGESVTQDDAVNIAISIQKHFESEMIDRHERFSRPRVL